MVGVMKPCQLLLHPTSPRERLWYVEIMLHCFEQPLACCQGKGRCKLLEVTSALRSSSFLRKLAILGTAKTPSYSKSMHGETRSSKHRTTQQQPTTQPSVSKSSPRGATMLAKQLPTQSTYSGSRALSRSQRATKPKAKSGR